MEVRAVVGVQEKLYELGGIHKSTRGFTGIQGDT